MARVGRPKHPLTNVVREVWAKLYLEYKPLDRTPNASDVLKELEFHPGRYPAFAQHDIVERTIRTIIKDLPVKSPDDSHPYLWEPWRDAAETPEETCYILKLRAAARLWSGFPSLDVSNTMALWAKRIRPLITDLDLMVQFLIVEEYEIRHEFSKITGDSPNTQPLDNLIAIQPWKKMNSEVWLKGVAAGRIQVEGSDFHLQLPLWDYMELRDLLDHYLQGVPYEPDLGEPTWQFVALHQLEDESEEDENETELKPVTFIGGQVLPEIELIETRDTRR